jgi:WD40 repeat protein
MDVLHVAWSPDGTRLASCSFDNLVMVWQLSEQAGAPRRLDLEGQVKGVEWDPVGKYLAAQVESGKGNATVVWRVRDWQVRLRPRA